MSDPSVFGVPPDGWDVAGQLFIEALVRRGEAL